MSESLAVRMTRGGNGNRARELRRREGRSPAETPSGAISEHYLEKVAVNPC